MASPLDLDELLLNVLGRLPEYKVSVYDGAIQLASRGPVERVCRRWRQLSLSLCSSLSIVQAPAHYKGPEGKAAAQPASQLAPLFQGRQPRRVEFWPGYVRKDAADAEGETLWDAVKQHLLPTARSLLLNFFQPKLPDSELLHCPLLEELIFVGDMSPSRQAVAASIRSSLPSLRRAELEMERVQIDVLEAVQHLEYVRLSLLNLPSTQQEWAALRALGPRACLDIDQQMDQADPEDLEQSWLPQGLLSLDSGTEVHLEVLGLPSLPWSGVGLSGLDRVPGLRRLALTCHRWRGPGFPPQLRSCSQLTQLYIGHARLYPPHLPAGALSQLPALLRLQLRNCAFGPAGQLRDDMCSLSQLTSLCVIRRGQHCLTDPTSRNHLQIPPARPLLLPPDVSQLRSLRQLALEGWQLTGLEALSANALTELSLAGSVVQGDAAMPWLAGLHVLHAPRTAASLDAVAGAALHLRGLALRDSGDVLEQGWPALKEHLKHMLWLEVLVVWVEGPDGSVARLRPWLQQRLLAAGLPLGLYVRSWDSTTVPPPPFQLNRTSMQGGKYGSFDPEPDGSDSDGDGDSEGVPEGIFSDSEVEDEEAFGSCSNSEEAAEGSDDDG